MEREIPKYYNAKTTRIGKRKIVAVDHNVWYDVTLSPITFQLPATPIVNCVDRPPELFLRNMPFIRFYIALCDGYDPVTVINRKFLKASRYIYYRKKKYNCTKYRIYKLPLADGIYEVKNMTTKRIHKRWPKKKAVMLYLEFKDGMMRWLPKRTAFKLILGDKYIDFTPPGVEDADDITEYPVINN